MFRKKRDGSQVNTLGSEKLRRDAETLTRAANLQNAVALRTLVQADELDEGEVDPDKLSLSGLASYAPLSKLDPWARRLLLAIVAAVAKYILKRLTSSESDE